MKMGHLRSLLALICSVGAGEAQAEGCVFRFQVRYEKTGTPLNKELREYVEKINKAKAAAKVEPEKVEDQEEEAAKAASGSASV